MDKYTFYDRSYPLTFPSGRTYTPEELAESDVYSALGTLDCAIVTLSDGVTYSYQNLGILKSRYKVEDDDPYAAVEKINDAIEREQEEIEESEVNAGSIQEKIEKIEANVASVQETAQSAMQAAQSAGADAQTKTVARLLAPTINFMSVPATDVVAIPDYIPEWEVGMNLAQNDPVKRDGQIYRASQAIPSTQEQYPPETAGESLYYPIEVAPDGVIVYRECHGQYDMVKAGETRHYPDAEGPVYRAKVDTAYDPDTVPDNWELVEEAA